jgi:hypothetical protein
VTATHASSGCSADVFIHVSYGGSQSDPYGLTIVTPTTTTLMTSQPNPPYTNPADRSISNYDYETEYDWNLTDSCGYSDSGIDQSEAFVVPWIPDYPNTDWAGALAYPGYASTSIVHDYMSHTGQYSVPPTNGGNVAVLHTQWTMYIGSRSLDCVPSCGTPVHTDTFQYYQDHGRHN